MIGQILKPSTREEKFSLALFMSLFAYMIYLVLGGDMWLPFAIGLLILSVFWIYIFIFDTQWNLIPSRNDQLMLFTTTLIALFTAYYSFMYVLPFLAIRTVKLNFCEDQTTDSFYIRTNKPKKEVNRFVMEQLEKLHNYELSYQEMCDQIKLELNDFTNSSNLKHDEWFLGVNFDE